MVVPIQDNVETTGDSKLFLILLYKVSSFLSLAKDLANCCIDVVLLNIEASYSSREGFIWEVYSPSQLKFPS